MYHWLCKSILLVYILAAAAWPGSAGVSGWYFPPPGEELDKQARRTPAEIGLKPAAVGQLRGSASRWALWRHGYLVHVEGAWNETVDLASLRKTSHAMTVEAFLGQGRIPSCHQPISVREKDLTGAGARATWRHVIQQASGFDFPHPDYPHVGDPAPGAVWTYSDKNPVRLCNALAKVFGRRDYHDRYEDVIRAACFDAIGMRGWKLRAAAGGIRFLLDLEDMGRLGLLALARGQWAGRQVVPRWFVEELERKQTYGMRAVYNGPDDGNVGGGWFHAHREKFPEPPYGSMTWTNTDGTLLEGAGREWAYGWGAGGARIQWNYTHGIVYAGVGVDDRKLGRNIAVIIEDNIAGPNPQVKPPAPAVGRFQRFETTVRNRRRYADPYKDVTLEVVYTRPDKSTVKFWGFYDGGDTWKLRFLADQLGVWSYEARFSDGAPGARGSFECVASDLPGMISADPSNPMWFGFSSGRHFLLRGFHVADRFFAANWPAEKRRAFLDWAAGQGYNTLSIASHFLNRDEEGRGRGWETPRLWPLDAAEYRKMEAILDELERRRIIVFPFAGFFGQKSNYPRDPAAQERYVRYTLARLASYWNMMWNAAGPEPNVGKGWMEPAEVHRLARLIKDLDPSHHLISVHNRTGDDVYKDADWSTYSILQGPKTRNLRELSDGLLRNHHPSKPLLAQETLWSGNKFHIQKHGGYSDDDVRRNAWVIHMSAAALVFADNDGDSSSGFTGTMEPGRQRQRHHDILRNVWDFFETVPFYHMKPRQDLTDAGYCLADPGRRYLVYLPEGGTVNVAVEHGPFRAEWINARNTAERRTAADTKDGRGLKAPEDGGDWLLYLTR
mgnify:CR=1 FL=1